MIALAEKNKQDSPLRVDLAGRSYLIDFYRDFPAEWNSTMPGTAGERVLLVTDENVANLYGGRINSLLEQQGATVRMTVVPPGENSKSMEMAAGLYAEAIRAGLDRRGIIVALGGGVVGDLAGFVAGTYLRGVRFVQIPTTLLAMVDSSVGGKTAVNLPQGKNLVGVFHQPVSVSIILPALSTLPRREFAAGMAEVIKYGAIRDASLFDFIEQNMSGLNHSAVDNEIIAELVRRCCHIKAQVVSADERESGERAILNFGHTLGHALEKILGYGVWLHGDAVAFGMVYAARLAETTGFCATPLSERLSKLCVAFGLPVDHKRLLEAAGGTAPTWQTVRTAMISDKKTLDSKPRFVLCEDSGRATFGCEVPEEILEEVWNGM